MVQIGHLGTMSATDDRYDEAILVSIGGETTVVPVTGVRTDRFDHYDLVKNCPDVVTFDRVSVVSDETSDHRIIAETTLDDGTTVSLFEQPGGDWEIHHHLDANFACDEVAEAWRRPGTEMGELTRFVNIGCSPAAALDYWAVVINGWTMSAWAAERGISHQAVSKNVSEASDRIVPGDRGEG